MRGDAEFDLFWTLVVQTQKQLHVKDPALQRRRKRPRRYEDGCEEHSFLTHSCTIKQCTFGVWILPSLTIRDRFHQHDYFIYVSLEQLLLKASSNEDYSDELGDVCEFFGCDFKRSQLETQLQVLGCMEINSSTSTPHALQFSDIHRHFKELSSSEIMLVSEVAKILKFVLLMPAMNAVSEWSASAMRRIKNYLRSTMTQTRLNNIMVLHIHKHLTDTIDRMSILNEFASCSDDGRKQFGVFS